MKKAQKKVMGRETVIHMAEWSTAPFKVASLYVTNAQYWL